MKASGPIQVLDYLTTSGKSPFRVWVDSLGDRNTQAAIEYRITRLSLGNFGDCKNVGGSVFELRIFKGPGYRVYFGFEGNAIVVLLFGGDKTTQSLDIKRAHKYWEDYKDRI